ncbi:hypothetical protein D3C78_1532440 [compost metagenome]
MVDGDQRQFVGRRTLQGGVGNTHRQWVGGRRWRAVQAFLQALVALDAFFDHVFGLALAPGQLDAIHAAIGVDVLEVVDEAAEKTGTAGRIRADAIALQREVLFVIRLDGEGRGGEAQGQCQAAGE